MTLIRRNVHILIVNATFACIVLAASASSSFAQNTCSARCPDGSMSPVYNCNSNSDPCARAAPNVPAGPSKEELNKRREAKDTQEAADDAENKGEEFYAKGDWANAAKAFQETLDLNPDDAVADVNLKKAQKRLRESEAAKQAINAQTRSTNAVGLGKEAGSKEAGIPFDDPDKTKNSGIPVPLANGDVGHKDPVVPASKRTAAITKLEQQRATDRKQRAALEEKLKTLDPQKDPVAISAIRQQESKLDNHINYVNFSIDDQLKIPSKVSPDKK